MVALSGDCEEPAAAGVASFHKLQLRGKANPPVTMSKQIRQLLVAAMLHACKEEFFRCLCQLLRDRIRIIDPVEPSLVRRIPGGGPIGDVEPVVTEGHVRAGKPPEKFVGVDSFKRSATGLEFEGIDTGACRRAVVVAHEHVPSVAVAESRTWIKIDASRPVAQVCDRRHDPSSLILKWQMPEPLCVPGTTQILFVTHVLKANIPAAIAPLQDVDDAGSVPAIGIIVAGEKVAVFVVGQILRISQAGMIDFKIGPVSITAEDRTAIR